MNKTFLLITLSLLFSLVTGAFAQSKVEYTYYDQGSLSLWGTSKAEIYNVAIGVNAKAMMGMKVVGFKVPLNKSSKKTSGHKVFLTKNLGAEGYNVVADILTQEFTVEDKWTTVMLDQPYTIDTEKFYAGVSFVVDEADPTSKKPLQTISGENPDGFMMLSSKSYRDWKDISSHFGLIYPLVVIVEGNIVANAATPSNMGNLRQEIDRQGTVTLTVTNSGTTAINDIDYTLEVDGEKVEGRIAPATPICGQTFGDEGVVEIDMPALKTFGKRDCKLTITKVNGADNNSAMPAITATVNVLKVVPKHRAVLEEFTGTWCPNCPVSIVVMEQMNSRHPEDFIGLAYHYGADIMKVTSDYPVYVSGIPKASIDRGEPFSPFFEGTSEGTFAVEREWMDRCEELSPAALVLDACYDKDQTTIYLTTKTYFAEDFDSNPYSLSYYLTADGLRGSGTQWMQYNGSSYEKIDFNDVVVAVTNYKGIEGSLPASVKCNDELTHTYSFKVKDIVSMMDNSTRLIQDITKVNAIAMLVETGTRRVVNAVKCRLTESTTGISSVEADSDVKVEARYNASGVRVDASHKGLTLLKMSDGTVRKAIVK